MILICDHLEFTLIQPTEFAIISAWKTFYFTYVDAGEGARLNLLLGENVNDEPTVKPKPHHSPSYIHSDIQAMVGILDSLSRMFGLFDGSQPKSGKRRSIFVLSAR